MAYLVVAYPDLSTFDMDWIQEYRQKEDALYYDVIAPHFTLVFPVFDIEESVFLEEMEQITKELRSFTFTLRSATINKDSFNDYFHTFLVPDEGNSNIIKIHDSLYSGLLKEHLRLDIDFIPHMGIGNSLDKKACKNMVDSWNIADFEIKGSVSKLTVIALENNIVKPLAEFILKK